MVAFSNGFTIAAIEGFAYVLLLLPIIFIFILLLLYSLKPLLVQLKNHLAKKATPKAVADAMQLQQIGSMLVSRRYTDHTPTPNVIM